MDLKTSWRSELSNPCPWPCESGLTILERSRKIPSIFRGLLHSKAPHHEEEALQLVKPSAQRSTTAAANAIFFGVVNRVHIHLKPTSMCGFVVCCCCCCCCCFCCCCCSCLYWGGLRPSGVKTRKGRSPFDPVFTADYAPRCTASMHILHDTLVNLLRGMFFFCCFETSQPTADFSAAIWFAHVRNGIVVLQPNRKLLHWQVGPSFPRISNS